MELKEKKVLLAGWGVENPKDTYSYQIYYLILKKIFPNLETFDTKEIYFQYGREVMNNRFIKILEEKKYDLVLFIMWYDEVYLETLEKMREKYPNLKSVMITCDDDSQFDSWLRYYALFFNHVITTQDYLNEYKRERISAFFHLDYNTYKLEPMNIEKIYDVTFIGRPKADRNEIIKYLLDNGIKVTLFGWDWYKYPEFTEVYKGPLSQGDYAKVINQSKINLSPAKAGYPEERNHYNMKGRYFEVALCKSFQLIEKFPTLLKFFNEKEIGMYNSQEDLLKKIKYYLKNEEEREKIAERAYNKTIKNYNREKQLINIFINIFKKEGLKELPKSNKQIITLKENDFKDLEKLKEKLKNYDFIVFENKNLRKSSKFKDYFLSRALEVTDKHISCCDYYLSSFGLEDYIIFLSKFSFKRIGNEAGKMIDINSLMVRKDFFLENHSEFEKIIKEKNSELMNEKNIAFVSIPLINIKKFKKIEYEKMKKALEMKFPNQLFSLMFQRKLLTSSYPYFLLLKSLTGNMFILKYLSEIIKDKNNRDKISLNESYIENSPLEKFKKK